MLQVEVLSSLLLMVNKTVVVALLSLIKVFWIESGKQKSVSSLLHLGMITHCFETQVKAKQFFFSKASDPNLESLATVSGGKTYFVKDGEGLEDINGVFEESNTYQPAVNSTDSEIIVRILKTAMQ